MEDPYLIRVFFYKDEHQLVTLRIDTHIIETSIVPEVPQGSLLTHVGMHKKNLGPDNIRFLPHDLVIQHLKNLPTGELCCIDVICYPTVEHINDPNTLVRHYLCYY